MTKWPQLYVQVVGTLSADAHSDRQTFWVSKNHLITHTASLFMPVIPYQMRILSRRQFNAQPLLPVLQSCSSSSSSAGGGLCSLFQVDALIWRQRQRRRNKCNGRISDASPQALHMMLTFLSPVTLLKSKTRPPPLPQLQFIPTESLSISHSSCVGLKVHSWPVSTNVDRVSPGKYDCFGVDCQG